MPGKAAGGAIFSRNGTVTIRSSPFAGNIAADHGGAIMVVSDAASVRLEMTSAILADSVGSATMKDCQVAMLAAAGGVLIDGGYNLIENNGGCGVPAVTADPQLAALASNGGPTFTHALPASSPAVDKGSCPTLARPISARPRSRGS